MHVTLVQSLPDKEVDSAYDGTFFSMLTFILVDKAGGE